MVKSFSFETPLNLTHADIEIKWEQTSLVFWVDHKLSHVWKNFIIEIDVKTFEKSIYFQ